MSMRGSNVRNRPGYFLPEDGQRRLAGLCASMRLLSRAAQPRTGNEARTGTPEVRAEELASSLELLAKQADMVLAQVSWPAYREAATDAPGRAAEAVPHAPDGIGGRFAFGVTLDQIDMLDRLIQMISAHGDVLAAGHVGALADRTLPLLGQAIFDEANAVRDILDRVETQRIGHARGPRTGVGEERAAYAARLARLGTDGAPHPVSPPTAYPALESARRSHRSRPH